jgi:SAM-dependent methyltransferase
MSVPHSSWASSYDQIYEKSFGSIYKRLTEVTLSQIQAIQSPPCDVVDFGAGTGRLSIPLSTLGYKVTAVEPCDEMLIELKRKQGSEEVNCQAVKMQDFHAESKFDIATCVFTVLIYLLDEHSLKSSIDAASRALRSGGVLLLDIPSRAVFNDMTVTVKGCLRNIKVQPIEGDLYNFSEDTELEVEGQTIKAKDSFQVRYWAPKVVVSHLEEAGFELVEDLSSNFVGTGSSYFLFRKIPT